MVQSNHNQNFSFLKEVKKLLPFLHLTEQRFVFAHWKNWRIFLVQFSSPDVKLQVLVSYKISGM